jgi:hypothetical protein
MIELHKTPPRRIQNTVFTASTTGGVALSSDLPVLKTPEARIHQHYNRISDRESNICCCHIVMRMEASVLALLK